MVNLIVMKTNFLKHDGAHGVTRPTAAGAQDAGEFEGGEPFRDLQNTVLRYGRYGRIQFCATWKLDSSSRGNAGQSRQSIRCDEIVKRGEKFDQIWPSLTKLNHYFLFFPEETSDCSLKS